MSAKEQVFGNITLFNIQFGSAQLNDRLAKLITAVWERLVIIVAVRAGGIFDKRAGVHGQGEIFGTKDRQALCVVRVRRARHQLEVFVIAHFNTAVLIAV